MQVDESTWRRCDGRQCDAIGWTQWRQLSSSCTSQRRQSVDVAALYRCSHQRRRLRAHTQFLYNVTCTFFSLISIKFVVINLLVPSSAMAQLLNVTLRTCIISATTTVLAIIVIPVPHYFPIRVCILFLLVIFLFIFYFYTSSTLRTLYAFQFYFLIMQKRQEPNVSDHSKHSVFICELYQHSHLYNVLV